MTLRIAKATAMTITVWAPARWLGSWSQHPQRPPTRREPIYFRQPALNIHTFQEAFQHSFVAAEENRRS